VTPAVTIVGLGRFGVTLGALLEAAKVPWEHLDASVTVEAYDAAAPLVVLAVPLQALASVASCVRARADQVIVDVCSVKVRAEQILQRTLGERRWIATHPLFGPAALHSDEARRAIVCPRKGYEADVEAVAALYTQLGCEVIRLDAAAHDLAMAESQALVAFVGGALRDAGLPEVAIAPPSSRALAELASAQNAQPGHLRDTMLFENDHAAGVRTRLLAAMHRLERAPTTNALSDLRREIDRVDRALILLLLERGTIATAISQKKAELGRPVQDPAREAAAFVDRRAWARDAGVDPDFVEAIFEAVLPWSRALQERARAGKAQR